MYGYSKFQLHVFFFGVFF